MDAISSAEHFHLFMQHADRIKMAGMAQPINVIHSMFLTRQSDGVLVKTPVFYLWKMFLPHHTANAKWAPNTLVTENVTGNNTSIPVISAGTNLCSRMIRWTSVLSAAAGKAPSRRPEARMSVGIRIDGMRVISRD